MNIDEKRVRSRQYISSPKFTETTFSVLVLFRGNIANMTKVFSLEALLLDKLDKGEIDHGLPSDILDQVKGFILLDGLAKIMMLAEGFLALVSALSDEKRGYKGVPKAMADYRQGHIDDFIERFQKGEVEMCKLAGFPDVDRLNLTQQDKEFISRLLKDSSSRIREMVEDIVTFYQCHRIPYNKLKHGLSVLSGFRLSGPGRWALAPSWVVALHHSGGKRLCCTHLTATTSIKPNELEWYDTIAIIPYERATFERQSAVLRNLLLLIEHIVRNHLDRASNCGEDYFPAARRPDGSHGSIILPYRLEGKDKERFDRVATRILRNMNLPEYSMSRRFNFTEELIENIEKCFAQNQVAIVRASSG